MRMGSGSPLGFHRFTIPLGEGAWIFMNSTGNFEAYVHHFLHDVLSLFVADFPFKQLHESQDYQGKTPWFAKKIYNGIL